MMSDELRDAAEIMLEASRLLEQTAWSLQDENARNLTFSEARALSLSREIMDRAIGARR